MDQNRAPDAKVSRARAVRLNPAGVEILEQALSAAWQEKKHEGRLTRAARAELMTLSVKTADRVLGGEPVDRASIVTAFAVLGVPFDSDQYLEVSTLERSPESSSVAEVPKRKRKRIRIGWMVLAVAVIGIAGLGGVWKRALPKVESAKTGEVRRDDAFIDAIKLFHAGKYVESETKLERILQSARDAREAGQMAEALRLLSDISLFRGHYSLAREQLTDSLNLRRMLNDVHAQASLHLALGDVWMAENQADRARREYEIALKQWGAQADEYAVAGAQARLRTAAGSARDVRMADIWFDLAEGTFRKLGRVPEQADVHIRRANVLTDQGNYGKALDHLRSALAIWEKTGHARWIAKCHYELAGVYSKQKDAAAAANHLAIARAKYAQVGDPVGRGRCDELATRIAKEGKIAQVKP